ncbi:ABC transporter permease [Arundinibacter roseus]|uniref:FtsX-like permease family protein n=1 Tax=Arundinibacter roseus TaxID=2070510 RepID=A0A4R4KDG0_9BACT|nr:ABC transporter permease [Arundinibacter roseus]TDB65920.1 FtsX-like permease family protein [Arundinibacter roseus]
MIKNYFLVAFRSLKRNSSYATINILGLGLGICCAILVFALVKYHLSFDTFHANSERIYRIVTEQHRDNITYVSSVPAPLGNALRMDHDFGEKIARIATFDEQLIKVKTTGETKKFNEENGIAFTEPGYFEIFNFPLLQGNASTALTEPRTALVTERVAKKLFGEVDPINQTFQINDSIEIRVTGLLQNLPPNTDQKAEIFISYPTLKSYNEWLASEDSWGGIMSAMKCYIRLRPQVSAAQVEAVLPAYVEKYRAKSKNVHHYKLQPLADVHFNERYQGSMKKSNLWVLSLIGLFLILTASVNFINLATAQALNRAGEVGIRKALGSLRRQIFWQFIAQTALITLLAGLLALMLAWLALPYVNQWFGAEVRLDFLSDATLLLFVPALLLLVTFLAGAYPGLILAGFQPIVALKGKLSQQTIGGFNTRRALIVVQFAISQALMVALFVIAEQMRFSKEADLGFDKEAVVMLPIASAPERTKTVRQELLKLSGVESVSLCFAAPAAGYSWNTTPYYDNRQEEEVFRMTLKAADDAYLSTFGLELVAGRNIFPSDTTNEFLVNEMTARKLNLSSPEELLGKSLSINGDKNGTIVGVIKDFHDNSFHEDISPAAVFSDISGYNAYAVKINKSDVATTLKSIEQTWSRLHPDQLYEHEFLDDQIASFYDTEALMLKLIQAFSLIAILIGCLGLYGLVRFMATQKTKEIGIRKVLGSSIEQILWIFGKEISLLMLIAFTIAAPVAWMLMSEWLQDFKYHIPLGPSFFVWAIAATFAVALITVSYQSIKAALMNPVKSLRSE